jgi:hypothetical protein
VTLRSRFPATEAAALDPVIDATALASRKVAAIEHPVWQLELAAHSAMGFAPEVKPAGALVNAVLQILASLIALLTLIALAARHGGTSPAEALKSLRDAPTVFAVHAEDTTRTRHLRQALAEHDARSKPILLLGRPASGVCDSARRFDPRGTIPEARYLRPLTVPVTIRALPRAVRQLLRGASETRRYRGRLSMRDRVAIAFRVALGTVHARWWNAVASGLAIEDALFAHTGNADTSLLEQAMQAHRTRTIHLVHGTNIGWAFAGLSDIALFQCGADARLGSSLPAYGRCLHLPLAQPAVSRGNGDWALLTSYTHLQHPAFAELGSGPDREVIEWVRAAAQGLGQDPARVFWRPHPQIDSVPAIHRERLEAAVAQAGFTRWPSEQPYETLGDFSVVVTTPSTALTDGLRLGQPVVVASLTAIQRDLMYARYPLLTENADALRHYLEQVRSAQSRASAFDVAWAAIEPGARPNVRAIFALQDR